MLRNIVLSTLILVLAGCAEDPVQPPEALLTPSFTVNQSASGPVVNSTADDGDGTCTDTRCTLRDAIAVADPGATITFDPDLTSGGVGTISLTQAELAIGKDLTISGPGADKLVVQRSPIAGSFRVFRVSTGTTTMSGITIANGRTFGDGVDYNGVGGGVLNLATLTLSYVTVRDNDSRGFSSHGGGIGNRGTILVVNSSITGNAANFSGAGISSVGGTMTVSNSTISGNILDQPAASTAGGGIDVIGGAVTLAYSTVTGNTDVNAHAGGLSVNGGTLTAIGSLIAGNIGPNCRPEFGGVITDGGFNLDDGTTCGFSGANHSLPATDPMLAGLALNGGPTRTHALGSNSPALNKIPAGTIGCGTDYQTDQRGKARPSATNCDIGSFEAGDDTEPTITITTPADGAVFLLGQSVLADYSCADEVGGSGVLSCTGPVASGSAITTGSVGSHAFTVNASDNASNLSAATVHYSVRYAFEGFAQPIENSGTLNAAKAGKTIPLKWRLLGANGVPVTTLTTVNVAATSLACPLGTTSDEVEEYATNQSGLQNLGNGYYQFNWAVPASYARSCKILALDLGDGTTRTAQFQFTK
ncbi:MAG TPA: PxKF domain-containing protein [Gemmatimonadales bacterium]|nr:PxKF domain-containing protein [Gemmatimonadales bacterium]